MLGCLTDTAASIVRSIIPAWTDDQLKQASLLAQEQLFSYGFTSALDAGVSVHQLDLYKELYEDGALKLRLYPLIMLSSTEGAEADYIRTTSPTGMLYDDHLHVAGVKIIGDGSLGARSSAMLEDYSDRAGYKGEYRFTDEEAYQVIKLAYDNGYQTGVHAIGDGTNHQVLDVYERLMQENPREDPRMRIEHFQIVTPDDIDRAIELGVLPAMQFTHATSDWLMAEDRVGSERIKSSYAWRTIIDKGSIIVGGSDAPVELVNPYHGLYAGVTRMDKDCQPEGGWYANEKVTREEALKAFTLWAAYGQFEEDIKGSLEAGKLADFVVIDRDYMTCPEEEIKDIQEEKRVVLDSVASRMGNKTIELENISKSYGNRKLISDYSYIFLKNDRIGIIGPNGCGKTTLLKIINGIVRPDSGTIEIGQTIRIGYFSQENEYMDASMKVIDYVKEVGEYVTTSDGKITASQMLERFLFDGAMQWSKIEKLSGGEKRRLYLMRVLMSAPNVLILDEPTNDLDIQTLTILEDYLDHFDGIIITVSHDRYFLDRIVNRIFSFEGDGKVRQFEGGYSDYLIRKELEGLDTEMSLKGHAAATEEQSTKGESSSKDTWKQRKPKLKFTYKEQREFETIDDDIAKLEEKLETLDAQIAANATNSVKLRELMEKKEETGNALDEKMERWVYLNDLNEKIQNADITKE